MSAYLASRGTGYLGALAELPWAATAAASVSTGRVGISVGIMRRVCDGTVSDWVCGKLETIRVLTVMWHRLWVGKGDPNRWKQTQIIPQNKDKHINTHTHNTASYIHKTRTYFFDNNGFNELRSRLIGIGDLRTPIIVLCTFPKIRLRSQQKIFPVQPQQLSSARRVLGGKQIGLG